MHAQVFEGQQVAHAIVERDFQHPGSGPEPDFGGLRGVRIHGGEAYTHARAGWENRRRFGTGGICNRRTPRNPTTFTRSWIANGLAPHTPTFPSTYDSLPRAVSPTPTW